jgi:hypothetical protein
MKTERIEIAQGAAITLPIYFRNGDKVQAYLPATEGKPGRYREVVASPNMVASWEFADASQVVKEVMGKDEVTREEFLSCMRSTIHSIRGIVENEYL